MSVCDLLDKIHFSFTEKLKLFRQLEVQKNRQVDFLVRKNIVKTDGKEGFDRLLNKNDEIIRKLKLQDLDQNRLIQKFLTQTGIQNFNYENLMNFLNTEEAYLSKVTFLFEVIDQCVELAECIFKNDNDTNNVICKQLKVIRGELKAASMNSRIRKAYHKNIPREKPPTFISRKH